MFYVNRSSPDHCFLKAKLAACIAFAAMVVGSLAVSPQVYSAEKPTAGKPKAWDQLVEKARREGMVVLYGPGGLGRGQPPVVEAFRKAYPAIKVQKTFGRGRQIASRILAERRANRFIPDVLVGGTSSMVITLKPAGVLIPLKPKLLMPEVLDASSWLYNRLWWADANEPYTTLMFQGYVQTMAYVNTKIVDPSQFRSYWDFLDPKWKGKIVATDIRRGGPGGVVSRFIYKHPQLGPRFLDRLFSELDITLSSDQQQMVDWLAKGRFQIGLFLSSRDVTRGQEQGLPVAHVPADQFKEGAPIAPGGGAVSLIDRARHPNAAKVLINWLLSREGQVKWQQAQRLPSLRVDISKEGLYPFDLPKPGVKYVMGGAEEYSRITRSIIRGLVTKALLKAGRH